MDTAECRSQTKQGVMMTRKTYVATAAVVRRELDGLAGMATVPATLCRLTLLGTAEGLADMFAADNPRFDRDRFLDACGFEL